MDIHLLSTILSWQIYLIKSVNIGLCIISPKHRIITKLFFFTSIIHLGRLTQALQIRRTKTIHTNFRGPWYQQTLACVLTRGVGCGLESWSSRWVSWPHAGSFWSRGRVRPCRGVSRAHAWWGRAHARWGRAHWRIARSGVRWVRCLYKKKTPSKT